jgi:hypothetical protein
MKLFGILLSVGALTQGIFAQQEFLAKLPSCAVRLLHYTHCLALTHRSVKMCSRNCVHVKMLAQRLWLPLY